MSKEQIPYEDWKKGKFVGFSANPVPDDFIDADDESVPFVMPDWELEYWRRLTKETSG